MTESMEDLDYSEEDPWTPPTPQRVAARALVMSAVACRGFIEKAAGDPEAEELRLRVVDWLDKMEVSAEIEPHEMAMLNAPLGTLSSKQAIEAGWFCEGLAMLAWALQRFPLPDHDKEVDPHDVAEALDFLWEDAKDILNAPTLRSQAEIEWLGDQLYDLNTRLRQFKRKPTPVTFSICVMEDEPNASVFEYVHLAENDLAIVGLPISQAEKGDIDTVISISFERHKALNWLLGQEAFYSQVTPDT